MSQGNSVRTLSGLQRLLEGGLIICCVLATYILLALASFSPSDPGWSQSHFQGDIKNWTGAVGAWIADILLYFFGITAYIMPIIVASTGWLLFKRAHDLLEIDYFSVALRIIGFLLLILGFSALASMNANNIYEFSAGGVAGDVIGQAMLPYFNKLGTTLLLLCFLGSGFTLLTGISWLTVVEKVGFVSIWCFRQLKRLPQAFKREHETEDTRGFMTVVDKFKQRRDSQHQLEKARVREPEAAPSRIFTSRPVKEEKDEEASDEIITEATTGKGKLSALAKILSLNSNKAKSEPKGQQRVEPQLDQASAVAEHGHFEAPPWVAHAKEVDLDEDETDFKTHLFEDDDGDDEPVFHRETMLDDEDEDDELGFNDEDVIDFDTKASTGAVAQAQRQKQAPKAKIIDGIVVLPGQEDKPVPAKPMDPLPSISLLDVPNRKKNPISPEELEQVARLVEAKLADFNIVATVVGVYPGPVITRFELDLAPGIKASKISNLANDLARSLLAERVRVVEVIPGKSYVGLELPNKFRETVYMRDVLDCEAFTESKSNLTMVLGQDISGEPVVVDLGKMPHLLVAGTTGSGKSVGVNVMITSLLYKSGPEDVRFIMIDPKMLELSVYEGIPHLLCEVVTDMKEAANALRWCVGEMERRYKLMSMMGVRNIKGYNAKIAEAKANGEVIYDPMWKSSDSMAPEAPALDKLPSIVVVVDEFADMMMIVGKKVEELIARIAQKARAAGIHLILATQRPSVDVITGLIKANIPTRMAFQVSSRIDSRTILDQQGAETLLGMGDMLYLPPGTAVPNRVHGAFIDDHEVHRVVADWCARGKPQYIDEILNGVSEGEQVLLPGETAESDEEYDPLYDEAVAFVTETRRGSISSVQRKFKIGYNRAARIIEQMEMQGVVSVQGHNGNREVLAPPAPKHY
ncbi:DNA translocase FtsK [Shewanella decolorationis]|uniref:DNA translocase FtsK n=1 Tax=Shewanella decolorationis S12 TaxID=1353536 RepID=A0ABN0PSS9_9GAMM|nr:DNA translocase FtsK [Shewanella decolorationis]ESE43319.1 cell division protein [Shewanella decolorationis S12]GLR31504.1 DNA translocase FtsK [Shewanella decolorationis]